VLSTVRVGGGRSPRMFGRYMKRFLSVVIVIGFFVAIGVRAFLDPIPIQRLERLRKGMNRDEVREVLGEPTKIYERGQWTYKRFLVFGFVNIHWRADGTYDGEYNYERF